MSCAPSLNDAGPSAGDCPQFDGGDEALRTRCLVLAQGASRELNAALAKLLMLLPFIKREKIYLDVRETLEEYLAEDLSLKPALGAELIRIGTALLDNGMNGDECLTVGLHKLGIVHKQLTPENQVQVVKDLHALEARELKARYQPPRPARSAPRLQPVPAAAGRTTSEGGPGGKDAQRTYLTPEQLAEAELTPGDWMTIAYVSAARATGSLDKKKTLAFIVREFLKVHPISDADLRNVQSGPDWQGDQSRRPESRKAETPAAPPVEGLDLPGLLGSSLRHPAAKSPRSLANKLKSTLREAVRLRLRLR